MVMAGRMEVTCGLSNTDLLAKADVSTATAECSIRQQQRATEPLIGALDHFNQKKKKEAALSPDWNRHLLWINMCLFCPQCFCRNHHLWTYRMPYSTLWYFTHKHYFWSVSLFYSKYNNRLMLGEFTDFIIFPIILKLLGDKMECLLKIQ